MSFFGSNPRPEFKGPSDPPERQPRVAEAKFAGDTYQPMNEPQSSPFAAETRSSLTSGGPTPPDKCSNVLAAGARWQGTLEVDESARIDGVFSGEIHAKGTVHISDGAEVDAKIVSAFVVVSGTFRGEIRAEQRVDLLPKSKVSGEVITKVLSVEEGATLDGSVQMTGESLPRGSSRGGRNGAEAESAAERRAAREAAANGVESSSPKT